MADKTPEQIAREYVAMKNLVLSPDTKKLAKAYLELLEGHSCRECCPKQLSQQVLPDPEDATG